MQREISAAESVFKADSIPFLKPADIDGMVQLYEQYAEEYPDDTLSADYLFKAGQLCVSAGRYELAITLFGKVLRYMNYRNASTAAFLQGFVADNHLHDTARARVFYEKFLNGFPQSSMADDARLMLQQMSLSPEELVRMFEQQQDSISTHP